jgi:hypothetical protein
MRLLRRAIILILGAILAITALVTMFDANIAAPVTRQEDLSQPRVFAYRGWQSVGTRVNEGDEVRIEAYGEWLYTPGEMHGPEGHARYPAPTFYPIPNVPGGVLIGRIGETGQPFVVGRGTVVQARQTGTLYLRINDDLLGDNWGWVAVDVDVTSPED